MSEPIISLRKLHIAFGEKDVIKDLDLDIFPGETLAIIGPSGSGKSTILRVLIGLLKPSGGQVLVEGKEVTDYTEDQWNELRKRMGMVFQYSALFDFLTVGENVAFGLRQHFHLPEEEVQQIVAEAVAPLITDIVASTSSRIKLRIAVLPAGDGNPADRWT